jgi:hypothetical protein
MRRLAYMAGVTTCCGAFALSLSGIATTQGHVKANGEAAAAVKHWQQQVAAHGTRCHRAPRTAPAPSSQREV